MVDERIIVIDGDPQVLGAMEDLLRQRNYTVTGRAATSAKAMQLIEDDAFDCAIVSMTLFKADAAPLVQQLRKIQRPFVLTRRLPVAAVRTPWLRKLPYLVQPFGGDDLVGAIGEAIAKHRNVVRFRRAPLRRRALT